MTPFASLRRAVAEAIAPELRQERRSLERDAYTDSLTSLANRRALDRALPAAEEDPRTLVILFDADNFGPVNKLRSHAEGDLFLRDMARSIERAAARYGFGVRVFRRGGDEFVVLASSNVACLIRDSAEAAFGVREVDGFRVTLTGSVGHTLARADAQLQARKARRKGAR